MIGVSLLLLGGLGSRLAYLQIVEGPRNRELADDNRIRLIPKPPQRGQIFDRKGRLLGGSRISYSVFLWPIAQEREQWPEILQRLSQILQIPKAEILSRLEKEGYNSPYRVRVARWITEQQVIAIEEARSELPGIEVDSEAVRYYPNGDLAAHVLGYTGEITDQELEVLAPKGYRLGDILGKLGIEDALESQLRGEWGGQQVEVDASGEIVRILGERPPVSGNDVTLTIDLDLQKIVEKALGNTRGAIVAIDPNNGGVLAMVSRPTYDPNLFSSRITEAQWQQLQSQEHPFVNRALQAFAPASTFKIVTTAAAIESGKYSTGTYLPTYPFVDVGEHKFWDWNNAGFGVLGFAGALAWSSDTFFYQIAIGIGGEILSDWTRRFGFGEHTGIELYHEESPGLVPDEAWKKEVLEERWYVGDTINMSIGQGYMQATPLQVAVMFAVAANGGDRVKPHLQKDNEEARNWRESLNLHPGTIEIIEQGLEEVMTYGTGGSIVAGTNLPPVAGKTGTAEDPPRENHAWFGAYAPADKPEIVVVAFAENSGGGGGKVTGPMVRRVLEDYFATVKPKQ
jgi:penicillin-binding protein 2